MIPRREWLRSVLVTAGAVLAPPGYGRVPGPQQGGAPVRADSGNLFAMDQDAWRSVRREPKPGASPSMNADARDALEHRLRCQCGCTLDVYTCRTTDFSCQVSPAMHRDVMAMVDGGYDEREIIDTFVAAYGDRVLMAPPKVGFNILGYVVPGIGVAVGAVVLMYVIRGMGRRPVVTASGSPAIDASPEELARLEAALRDDE